VLPSLPEPAYVFTGPGLGVPGLPHRVTPAQCRAQPELEPLLLDAIAAGMYRLEEIPVTVAAEPPSEPPAEPEGE
jgi:hypothetical protein